MPCGCMHGTFACGGSIRRRALQCQVRHAGSKASRRSFRRPQDRPGVLQALLGHANLVTTARYLHPDKAQVQAMVKEL